jgi:hypothetical protein
MTNNNWEGARCDDPNVMPEIFFSPHTVKEAVEYCKECPIAAKCAAYAIKENIPDGVWGGLTEQERKDLRKTKRGKHSRAGISNRKH